MLTTKRKPASVGEILIEEFMEPISKTASQALAVLRATPRSLGKVGQVEELGASGRQGMTQEARAVKRLHQKPHDRKKMTPINRENRIYYVQLVMKITYRIA
jgi:hypothetical protein